MLTARMHDWWIGQNKMQGDRSSRLCRGIMRLLTMAEILATDEKLVKYRRYLEVKTHWKRLKLLGLKS